MRSKLILLVIIFIFVIHCLSLNFTQDDAFISYRYVKNFIQGNGLVFNSGERVEGYTNFFWIILLSIFAKLGLDMITVSKILGIASGCVTLFLLHQISQLFFPKRDWLFSLFPSFLLTSSSAFAYWSISGLETTFFVMMVLVSVYLYLTYPRLWVVSCVLSTLIRPEGGLIFGVLILHKLLFRKDPLRESLSCLGGFVLLLLPFLIFKVFYYGDILPNPFYAKTGFSLEYVKSGLEYFWLFLRHYGLWGLFYLVPIFFYKSLDSRVRLLILLVYLYTLYVILIGGDVLKVHRFFLPILPLLYLLFVIFVQKLYTRFKSDLKTRMALIIFLLSIPAVFFILPHKWIRDVRSSERQLVNRMLSVVEYLKANYGAGFSMALTIIGSASYYLGTEVKVIDMLGLTDKYISCHPEKIEGITVTWKERNYNTRYLLSLDPDFILFSTAYKPSAPAERALLLNSKFRQNYYVIPVLFGKGEFVPIFKRKGSYSKENELFGDTRFIDLFCEGVYLRMRGRVKEAIQKLKQVTLVGPQDFALVYELLGQYYFKLKDYDSAETYLKRAIQIDDRTVLAHAYLAATYRNTGRLEEAEEEEKKVYLYDPNFPR
ncbi:MAG: tetratricopeptide repeat protein [candidate division Zixibacteria bacterium]|nr:tetratricopeptide repeat protein [candidate division Zixibacteria bacterium]